MTICSTYTELPPPLSLAGSLVCTWSQEIGGARDGAYAQSVLPDGCVDIVWLNGAAPVVAGPATRRVIVDLPCGSNLFGVRFRPGAAARFLGVPMAELRNRDVPLRDIWDNGVGTAVEEMLWRPVHGWNQKLKNGLAKRIAASSASDLAVAAAIRWLARHPQGRVYDLARQLDISERQLRRRFLAAVGCGPKMFQRIMRLQRLLNVSTTDSRVPDLADLAGMLGYADQAHMCREVHTLSGAPPAKLLINPGSTLSMSDLFNTAPVE